MMKPTDPADNPQIVIDFTGTPTPRQRLMAQRDKKRRITLQNIWSISAMIRADQEAKRLTKQLQARGEDEI